MFENGIAKETVEVVVHEYNCSTKMYASSYEVRILAGTGLPANSVLDTPSSPFDCWNGSCWVLDEEKCAEAIRESMLKIVNEDLTELNSKLILSIATDAEKELLKQALQYKDYIRVATVEQILNTNGL